MKKKSPARLAREARRRARRIAALEYAVANPNIKHDDPLWIRLTNLRNALA